jgi:hypothetical protein
MDASIVLSIAIKNRVAPLLVVYNIAFKESSLSLNEEWKTGAAHTTTDHRYIIRIMQLLSLGDAN